MDKLAKYIREAKSILLSTHKQCDGDGLGAELAMFHALKSQSKKVEVINVDATPKKYRFLEADRHIRYFDSDNTPLNDYDLCLIFDTNDHRLLEPLYSEVKKKCRVIAFVDHHPILIKGPSPSNESIIDTKAASTGEMVYNILKELSYPLNREVARALYTSITFDTQLYRFIRNSPRSHEIAAELLKFNIDTEEIHRALFGNQTPQKIAFLAKALSRIEYHCDGRMALLKIHDQDLTSHNLEVDESRDVIDMLMSIEQLEAAVLIREDSADAFKISLRSKGRIEVLPLAESLAGGGHAFAAGAFIKAPYQTIHDTIVAKLTELLEKI